MPFNQEELEELRQAAREREDQERIDRQKKAVIVQRTSIVVTLLVVSSIAGYNILKKPKGQTQQEDKIVETKPETTDHTAGLSTNPEDTKLIREMLSKLPDNTPDYVTYTLKDTLDILLKDSEGSNERRQAVLTELKETSSEEFILTEHPYSVLQELYPDSPLYQTLMNSQNPRLKPLQSLVTAFPVSKDQDPGQEIRNLTLLLDKLAENPELLPGDLKKMDFEETIAAIRDGKKISPISLASILYARKRPEVKAPKTSSYLDNLRKSPINRQSKRDVLKLA